MAQYTIEGPVLILSRPEGYDTVADLTPALARKVGGYAPLRLRNAEERQDRSQSRFWSELYDAL